MGAMLKVCECAGHLTVYGWAQKKNLWPNSTAIIAYGVHLLKRFNDECLAIYHPTQPPALDSNSHVSLKSVGTIFIIAGVINERLSFLKF